MTKKQRITIAKLSIVSTMLAVIFVTIQSFSNKYHTTKLSNVLETPKISRLPTADKNYTNWTLYTNETHHYSLQVPPGWIIDDSRANKIEKYTGTAYEGDANDGCCNYSELIVKNEVAEWIFVLDSIYTGGGGVDAYSFPDICIVNDDTNNLLCSTISEGPFEILGLPLFKKSLIEEESKRILHVSFGQKNSYGSIMPIFYMPLEEPVKDIENRVAGIEYTGNDITNNLEILDKITASLKWFD